MLIPDNYKIIFNQFAKEEAEYLKKILHGTGEIDYPHGILFGKLTESNDDIIKLINDTNKKIKTDGDFTAFITKLEQNKNEKYAESLRKRIEESKKNNQNDNLSEIKLKHTLEHLQDLDFNKLYDNYKSISTSLSDGLFNYSFTDEEFAALSIIELLYDYFKITEKRFEIPSDNSIELFYSKKGIKLHDADKQYNKHKLLTIDSNDFEISNSNIPKVYDKRFKIYIPIKETPAELLKYFKQLMENGSLSSIALRPDYTLFDEKLTDLSYIGEELERGEIFSFGNLGTPSVSKLYNKNYDTLWITIDEENITFEELIRDPYIYKESIVTQVIHLKYKEAETQNPIITHIDHEFIFYTPDEYRIRQSNHTQKGSSTKRYKTFKIDNSRIPFYNEERFILYYILEKFFKETELIFEYFQSVLSK